MLLSVTAGRCVAGPLLVGVLPAHCWSVYQSVTAGRCISPSLLVGVSVIPLLVGVSVIPLLVGVYPSLLVGVYPITAGRCFPSREVFPIPRGVSHPERFTFLRGFKPV